MNCVDLFAGAGGFSLAAHQSGLDVRLAIELNHYAVSTYKANLCEKRKVRATVYDADITTLSPTSIFRSHFRSGEICDLMLGGPPCQGFSSHRIKNAGVDDPRNELIHSYFQFVEAFKPSYFLLENVPGMLWPRHKGYLEDFYNTGRAAGYHIYPPVVLDARDYGVPQRRKRVFILGVLLELFNEGLTWPPLPTHASPTLAERLQLLPWKTCEEVFNSASDSDPNNIHMTHGEALTKAFENTPHNGGSRKDSGRVLSCHKDHDGHKDVYGRINPFESAPTMTTACYNPSKGRFVHPTKNHGLTLREAARIQTFPDEFIFSGGLTPAGRQIGNAVPVVLAESLINHLKPSLTTARIVREIELRQSAA